jgi:hypothetical protein
VTFKLKGMACISSHWISAPLPTMNIDSYYDSNQISISFALIFQVGVELVGAWEFIFQDQ